MTSFGFFAWMRIQAEQSLIHVLTQLIIGCLVRYTFDQDIDYVSDEESEELAAFQGTY